MGGCGRDRENMGGGEEIAELGVQERCWAAARCEAQRGKPQSINYRQPINGSRALTRTRRRSRYLLEVE